MCAWRSKRPWCTWQGAGALLRVAHLQGARRPFERRRSCPARPPFVVACGLPAARVAGPVRSDPRGVNLRAGPRPHVRRPGATTGLVRPRPAGRTTTGLRRRPPAPSRHEHEQNTNRKRVRALSAPDQGRAALARRPTISVCPPPR